MSSKPHSVSSKSPSPKAPTPPNTIDLTPGRKGATMPSPMSPDVGVFFLHSSYLPPSLQKDWRMRGYYGTVSHNSKAVFQRYLSWYDGNPANLNPLPPVKAARKYVSYMGGADATLEKARADFEAGCETRTPK